MNDAVVPVTAVEVVAPDLRSELAVAEPDPIATVEPEAESVDVVSVRISVDSLPWLAEGQADGSLSWSGGGGDDDGALRFKLEPKGDVLIGRIELSSAPTRHGEFTDIFVAGLCLHTLSLRPLASASAPGDDSADDSAVHFAGDSAGGAAPQFELLLQWTQGASLVWADSVPQGERTPVAVSLGGRGEPRTREGRYGNRDELVQLRPDLELPLRLPKLKREELVWVGAADRMWRSFPAAPEATRIEVILARAASIRVLHDVPTGEAPQYVLVTAFPKGQTDIKPVSASGVVEFTERPVSVHEVAVVASRDRFNSKRLSRLARLDLVAGEEAVVDLTSDYAKKEFGTLRVRLVASPEVSKVLSGKKRKLSTSRRAPAGGKRSWERLGDFLPMEDGVHGAEVHEMTGLEPGLHRVLIEPSGHVITDDVVAGEVHELEVSLDNLGWVKLVLPEGYPRRTIYVNLTTAEADTAERTYIQFGSGMNEELNVLRPTAAGRYFVQARSFSSDEVPALESDEFVVRAGETTEVILREKSLATVEVVALNADTDEPIGLALTFWTEVQAVGTQTGSQHLGTTSFSGAGDSYTQITWRLDEVDEPVEIRVPDNPFWEFEAVEPLRLEDGTKIVLRGTRKGT